MKTPISPFKKTLLVLIAGILSCISLFAQMSTSKIIDDDINDSLLISLLQTKTDSVRIHHKATSLQVDHNLQKAALNHVSYIMKHDKLTHVQESGSNLYDPFDRANYYKANFGTVGENIAYTYLGKLTKSNYGKPHINLTYEEVADDLVKMWKHSPEHFKNLVLPGFSHSGIAIAYSHTKQAFYAVQVYGGNKKK